MGMLITRTEDLYRILPELEKMDLVAVDTETTGLDPHLNQVILFQIGTPTKQFLIDTRKASLEPLRSFLEGPKPKVLHNAKFDYKMIRGTFGIKMENLIDTMILEQVLTSGAQERGFGLKDLAAQYLNIDMDKSERSSFMAHTGDFTEAQLDYAIRDIIHTYQILLKQVPKIVQQGLEHTAKLECLVIPAFGDMEFDGFFLDTEKWNQLIKISEIERDKAKAELDRIFKATRKSDNLFGWVDINYDSDEQLKKALADLGIHVEDTSRETLMGIKHEVKDWLLIYREHQKVLSTYGESFLKHIHPKTGRIHCDFKQLGAESGRVSCTNPNLQNIKAESEFRSAFVAPPGRKIITCDYSGCELRIIAELSEDPVFLKTFHEGGDLHAIVASTMFNKPVSKTENPELRKQAKFINFGLAYGMGAQGLATLVGCSEKEAEKLLNQYFKTYPKIKKFLDNAAKKALKEGYSETIGGRKRYYDISQIHSNPRERAAIERKAKNAPIQGTNADMTKLALVYIREEFKKRNLDALLVNTVHDEIVVESAEEIAEEVGKLVHDCMVKAGKYYLTKVPVEVEYEVAEFWKK
ncbi:MAG TPA: DNA polymerase [Candidatus Limnocylindrales bacterium]|nr:DNA polymerase [Candidatus Limnocylindrales bacterium]